MNDKLKVLIAEDNAALNGILRFNLEKSGFAVVAAKNGKEASEYAVQYEFDIIVSDQQMPQMTGVELCEFVRTQTSNAKIPFVLLTAKAFEVDAEQLKRDLDIAQVLHKPFSPSAIVNTVNSLLTTFVAE